MTTSILLGTRKIELSKKATLKRPEYARNLQQKTGRSPLFIYCRTLGEKQEVNNGQKASIDRGFAGFTRRQNA